MCVLGVLKAYVVSALFFKFMGCFNYKMFTELLNSMKEKEPRVPYHRHYVTDVIGKEHKATCQVRIIQLLTNI